MAKKSVTKKSVTKKSVTKKSGAKKSAAKKGAVKLAKGKTKVRAADAAVGKKVARKKVARKQAVSRDIAPQTPLAIGSSPAVLERLYSVILARRDADPAVSHSARLLSRGTAKIAQKFGEEAVECLIEAVSGDRAALIAESADVLYHLMVIWVNAGVGADEVWAELHRREGVSGIAEKASRVLKVAASFGTRTTKIP